MNLPALSCKRSFLSAALSCLAGLAPMTLHGELVRLVNGDVYHGKLLSVDDGHVVIQSEIQGQIQLPRNKVALIDFQNPMAQPSRAEPPNQDTKPQSSSEPDSANQTPEEVLRQARTEGIDPNTLAQVRQSLLGAAGPEAQHQFNSMLKGLTEGTLSMEDLREKARHSADQIRQYRDPLEEEAGPILDHYLAILENFLQETTPAEKPDEEEVKDVEGKQPEQK